MKNKEATIKFILHIVKTRRNIFLVLMTSIICFFIGVGFTVLFNDIYWMLIILFLNIFIWIMVIITNYKHSLSIGYRIPEKIGPQYISFRHEMRFMPWPKKVTTNKLINAIKNWKENKEDLI